MLASELYFAEFPEITPRQNESPLITLFREGLNPEIQLKLACKDAGMVLNQSISLAIRLDQHLRVRPVSHIRRCHHRGGIAIRSPPLTHHTHYPPSFFLVIASFELLPMFMCLNALDGRPVSQSLVTHITAPVCLTFPEDTKLIQFFVLAFSQPILGLPWLRKHNPHIAWRTSKILS